MPRNISQSFSLPSTGTPSGPLSVFTKVIQASSVKSSTVSNSTPRTTFWVFVTQDILVARMSKMTTPNSVAFAIMQSIGVN